MSSEEKLEQSTIVKERGTVYFKVSPQQGPQTLPGRALPRQRGFCQEVDRLAPAAVTKWIWAGWSGWGGAGVMTRMPLGHWRPRAVIAWGRQACAGSLSLPLRLL